jgi:hypothetical protein
MIRLENIEQGVVRGCSVPPAAVPLHIEGAGQGTVSVADDVQSAAI